MSPQRSAIHWDSLREKLAGGAQNRMRSFADNPEKVRSILRDRAAFLATRGERHRHSTSSIRVIQFSLGEERYAVPLSALVGIIPAGEFGNVPGAAPELAGILHARGEIWSVFLLSELLALHRADATPGGLVLLLRDKENRRVGLLIDAAQGIRDVDIQALSSLTGKEAAALSTYIRGSTQDGLMLIDIATLWTHPSFLEAD